MKLKNAVLILTIGILFSISVTFTTFLSANAPEILEIPIHFNVSSVMGFDVNASALNFGTIPPTGTGSRDIVIRNEDDYSKRVGIRFFGEAARWTYTENSSFILEPYERQEIPVKVSVPENAASGSYSGFARIYLTRAS